MLKAIIFDFDGVITDSEPAHLKMFQKALSEKGISLNEREYYEVYLGMDDRGCFSTILKSHEIDADPDLIQSLIQKKTEYLMEYLKNDLFIYPGVADLIEQARGKYSLAIASGALKHEIEYVLHRTGFLSAFSVIVSAEDVDKGKPDPECFNKALQRLNEPLTSRRFTKENENGEAKASPTQGWEPTLGRGDFSRPFSDENRAQKIEARECLVIEDSIAGIEAARAAGMKCVAVTNTYGCERLTMADLVVKSLEDIIDDLEELFK